MKSSVEPCARGGRGAKAVSSVAYLYNQTLYDLSLASCSFDREFHTDTGTFADVVDGLFLLRNRTTRGETKFRVSFGTSGELRELPVRAVFRPRWWMEVELVLDRLGNGVT